MSCSSLVKWVCFNLFISRSNPSEYPFRVPARKFFFSSNFLAHESVIVSRIVDKPLRTYFATSKFTKVDVLRGIATLIEIAVYSVFFDAVNWTSCKQGPSPSPVNFFPTFFAHSLQKSGLTVQIMLCPFKINQVDVLTGIATWVYFTLTWFKSYRAIFFLTFFAQESVTVSQNMVEPLKMCLAP